MRDFFIKISKKKVASILLLVSVLPAVVSIFRFDFTFAVPEIVRSLFAVFIYFQPLRNFTIF